MRVVFQEYAWDMGWCDPCAADPLSGSELQNLGVFWLETAPASARRSRLLPKSSVPGNVFVTRLHLRYDAGHFPEDLVFQETTDRNNFQGRYILRHPWQGPGQCPAAAQYREQLPGRKQKEAQTLAHLTGWNLSEIYRTMQLDLSAAAAGERKWYQKIWKNWMAVPPTYLCLMT